MIKNAGYTYRGANQDISKSKHKPEFYYEGQHIKILATDKQSSGSLSNEKGNDLVVSIPNITISASANTITYGAKVLSYENGNEIDTQIASGDLPSSSTGQIIIGHSNTRDGVILFTTDESMDCIWLINGVLNDSYDLELLYVRNLKFTKNSPIQSIYNYENENIQKVYWVDGTHQIRFINITNNNIEDSTPLIDVPSSTLNFVGNINLSQPTISDTVGGGIHTAGMIQYGYNLYRLNSSQTKLSPLSELIPLDKGTNLGGGAVNEVVGSAPIVDIDNIDQSFTNIKVYAIKYTSYNQIPSISLIEDKALDGQSSITVFDDGNIISTLTLEQLLFLGSDPAIPKHIETKDNRLFLANIETKDFIIPDVLDMRAYSFPISSTTTKVYKDVQLVNDTPTGSALTVTDGVYNVSLKHDAINLNYDTYKYQAQSTNIGAEGKYIKLQIVNKNLTSPEDYRVLKDRELYRFGIEFYNSLGQKSLPLWIADLKMPTGNLENSYNTLKVELTSAFTTWLNTYSFENEEDKPIGYKILRANRTVNDKTILCQGIVGGMMVNSPRDSENAPLYNTLEKRNNSQVATKLPNILLRTFQEISPLKANAHLDTMMYSGDEGLREIQHDSSERKADTYQYTVMYQLYSPEILFSNVNINSSTKFNVIGGAVNSTNNYWGQERHITTKIPEVEIKALNKLTPHASGGTNLEINGGAHAILERGLIAEPNGCKSTDEKMSFNQWYREFNSFTPASNVKEYDIFGAPELTERGQGNTTYGNNSKYIYSNNLEGFLTDGEDDCPDDGELDKAIISINSYGGKCITFVADRGDNADIEPHTRTKMEDLYSSASINNTNTTLISEFVRPVNDLYFGNIYGGNSYENKKRTEYIGIGSYQTVATTTNQIDSPGDTYVQLFNFERIAKTDTEVYGVGQLQYTELVSVKLETTIDLKNRNDISQTDWDSRFQPRYDEYHEYNNVYSQQPTLVKSTNVDYNFKRIQNFDTRIQTTKVKIPNESIDSWTDILANEIMDINGKHGPINSIISHNDNIYSFQDEAIAAISINPRVQVQGNDGVAIELGTGGILYDYNYITTKSGTINKWSVLAAKKGIYYYDAYNKAIGRVPDSTGLFLTDVKGLHAFFNNNYIYDDIKIDNPIISKGVVFGHDNYNNDIYFTLHQGDKSFTWCYNEIIDQFIDLKSYKPSSYIYKGEKFLLSDPNNNKLYEQYKGDYNKFFGVYQPSYVTLQVNPEPNKDCTFNNIFYKSEVFLNGVDQPTSTLTGIQAFNEYQDSGLKELKVGRNLNLRRKFREWKANIPRDGRDRIRNPWIFLKLQFDNENNYNIILHDMILFYSV